MIRDIAIRRLLAKVGRSILIGEIKTYAGATEPDGWMMCDGREVSRSDYSKLFDVIGTTYGAGDGSTTFNIPDLRDRFPVGAGSSYNLNAKGGSPTVTLSVNEMPNHGHINTSGDVYWYTGVANNNRGTSSWGWQAKSIGSILKNTGGGQAHENRPPYIGLNFLIYHGGVLLKRIILTPCRKVVGVC